MDEFKFDINKAKPNDDCVFKGSKYRITVLTERLVRLEYNENGIFENSPTEIVWYRNLPKPDFSVTENNKILNIKTKYFELSYVKDKKFTGSKLSPSSNLKITLNNTNKVWYYGHPEVRNFGTSTFSLDEHNKKNGLYSLDGFATIDDSKSNIILEDGSFKKREYKGIDIYVFLYNKDFFYCLNDYFSITGYPPLIPRYALGNWWDKKESYSEVETAHLIKKFEDNNIPISLFVLNNWQVGNNFEFSNFYKDQVSLINYIHSQKIKVALTIDDPYVFKPESSAFSKLETHLIKDEHGNIPFNVYDAKVMDVFLKVLINPLNQLGIDLYSINTFNKKDLDRLTILKHYLYYNTPNSKRALISSRNSLVASHRYPILYSGKTEVSWDTLKKLPSFNMSSTNFGVSFTSSDVGGTTGGIEDNELFIRFIELATFSPILRLGSDGGKYYKREPWKWSLKPREIATTYLNLRHSLIPYLYTEAYKYFKYGKPLIEPLYYSYPDIYDSIYKNEYLFGSTFLVCPITEKKDYIMNRVIHKIYIPSGTWYGFFTGKQYKGNKKYTSFYRDHQYPVFVKAGAIIPLDSEPSNDTSTPKKLEIQVFPGANNTYSIYEDDGETNNYLKGDYLITNIEFVYDKDRYKLTILPVSGKVGVIPSKRDYKIRFKNTKVTSQINTFVASNQIKNEFYKDDTDLVIEVKDIPTNEQFTVICSGQDLEVEASRIINDDITEIISDLPIKTVVKQRIDNIMFSSELTLKKKRIEIRKLANGKDYIERKYIQLLYLRSVI